MKCEICNQNIVTTFLNKKRGTVIKDEQGKQHFFCSGCQQKFKDKQLLLDALS